MVLKANTDAFIETEKVAREWSGPAFWIYWVGATTIGWAVMLGALAVIAGLSGADDSPAVRVAEPILALGVYALQWLVLRPWMDRAWRWMVVSFAGAAIGLALFLTALAGLRAAFGGETVVAEVIAESLLVWVPPAVGQWLLLRPSTRSAWRWLVANVLWMALFLPFAIGGALMQTADGDMEQAMDASFGVVQVLVSGLAGAGFGFVVGAITGAEMAWLLRHPKGAAPSE